MNFDAENKDSASKLTLVEKPDKKAKKNIKVVVENNGKTIKGLIIMSITALIAIITLLSGATLYHHEEKVNVYGDGFMNNIYNKTFENVYYNMYDSTATTILVIIGSILLISCVIILFLRRKLYPGIIDYACLMGAGSIAVICFCLLVGFACSSTSNSSGKAGVLSAHERISNEPTFAFILVLICLIVFVFGIFIAIQGRRDNSTYIKVNNSDNVYIDKKEIK